MNAWGAFGAGILIGYVLGYVCLALMSVAQGDAWRKRSKRERRHRAVRL